MNNEYYIITLDYFNNAKGTHSTGASDHCPTSKKAAADYLSEACQSGTLEHVIQVIDGIPTNVTDEIVDLVLNSADDDSLSGYREQFGMKYEDRIAEMEIGGSSWSDHVGDESRSSNFI